MESTTHLLELEIVKVLGAEDGRPKGLVAKGILKDETGNILESFEVWQKYGSGLLGELNSGCGLMKKSVRMAGKDIASWLISPLLGATLGNV